MKELLENDSNMQEEQELSSYDQYKKLGGIINETDYNNALAAAENINRLSSTEEQTKKIIEIKEHETLHRISTLIKRAVNMMGHTGIELRNTEETLDPRVVLFVILRSEKKPSNVKYHHGQMSDEQILVEALRMLGDSESVEGMIDFYGDLFKYESADEKK